MEIITRQEAKILGLKTYFTGEACKHGHLSTRRSSNGSCSECSKIQLRNRDPQRKSMLAKEYYKRHAQNRATYSRKYREENPEKVRATQKSYRERNTKAILARNAKRRADKMLRTPKWSETSAIRQFYLECPEGYHVDHIVPLLGKSVCGLHVLSNLQYLPALGNLKKGNSFEA